MNDHSILTSQLLRLKAKRIPYAKLYDLLHEFGEARFIEAAPEVAKFLHHRHAKMRYIAVMVLALHWGLVDYRNELERLFVNDPNLHVRRISVAGLGHVLRETRDPRATRLLLQKLRDNSEAGSVRDTSYEALLDIWFPEARRTQERIQRTSEEINEGLASIERIQSTNALPEPLRRLAFAELRKNHRGEERKGKWASHVDWNLVAKIERGEIR